MIRTLLVASVAVAALNLAACGQKTDDTARVDTEATEPVQQPSANPTATIPTPSDEAAAPDFVAKAGAGDMFEIETSRLALKRSTNPQVKKFAQSMIDAHTKTTAELKKAIAASGRTLSPPAVLPDDLRGKVDDLGKVDAKDFDRKYMDAQADGHQAALDLFQRYANDGDVAEIKAFATATAPTIQEHLNMAKSLRDTLK